jgi:hypothetical protein
MSRARPPQQNERLLHVLTDGGVIFAVIGGVAALLHGASQMTVDLDVAAPFDEENLSRLCAALAPFAPRHATRPDLSVLDEPMERLQQFRLLLIDTQLGRLDVLREVQPLGDFQALRTIDMVVYGITAKVLARDDLIRVKRTVARPKDIAVALELEAAREREAEG